MKLRPTAQSRAFLASVSAAITYAAEVRGTTYYKLCLSIGMSKASTHSIKAGRANLTLDSLHRIASALNMTPATLLRLAEISKPIT